ncbi:HNH endonuclease [Oceanobacillus damuensis]|uniref:HNH endonuclease n=1 Tax=Oceanobacillus damuensis TaxID=937928 RepID=UPI000B2FB537|nr:HNH endonuclease signature motif containing protein [Oceanobacillus damuensis]
MEIEEMKPGITFSNNDITDVFGCSPQGGMRRSYKTNSLVLVSNHTKALYEDRWEGNIFHYTGMGQVGNQTLTSQNKTLAESRNNSIEIYLFEVFVPQKYIYIGKVYLAEKPYQEEQVDNKGFLRLVWVFPIKLEAKQRKILLPDKIVKKKQEQKMKKVQNVSEDQLAIRAKAANKKISKRKTTTFTYEFDPYVSQFAKRWANGQCQLCEQPAPFLNEEGEPYLIAHHLKPLSQGGLDSVYNTVALCPNCHEKMNVLREIEAIKRLERTIELAVDNC